MTRLEILQKYAVAFGKIQTAGQFHGQALYVPYFWDIYLAGNAHEVSEDVVQFSVVESDRVQFPELGSRSTIRLMHGGGIITEA